jgi:hypothetical protein
MRRTAQKSVGAMVARSLTSSTVAVGLLAVLALAGPGSGEAPGAQRTPHVAWKDTYARRYPGCVPVSLWPAEEQPVAILVRMPGGSVQERRVGHLVGARPAMRTIGVCRDSGAGAARHGR